MADKADSIELQFTQTKIELSHSSEIQSVSAAGILLLKLLDQLYGLDSSIEWKRKVHPEWPVIEVPPSATIIQSISKQDLSIYRCSNKITWIFPNLIVR